MRKTVTPMPTPVPLNTNHHGSSSRRRLVAVPIALLIIVSIGLFVYSSSQQTSAASHQLLVLTSSLSSSSSSPSSLIHREGIKFSKVIEKRSELASSQRTILSPSIQPDNAGSSEQRQKHTRQRDSKEQSQDALVADSSLDSSDGTPAASSQQKASSSSGQTSLPSTPSASKTAYPVIVSKRRRENPKRKIFDIYDYIDNGQFYAPPRYKQKNGSALSSSSSTTAASNGQRPKCDLTNIGDLWRKMERNRRRQDKEKSPPSSSSSSSSSPPNQFRAHWKLRDDFDANKFCSQFPAKGVVRIRRADERSPSFGRVFHPPPLSVFEENKRLLVAAAGGNSNNVNNKAGASMMIPNNENGGGGGVGHAAAAADDAYDRNTFADALGYEEWEAEASSDSQHTPTRTTFTPLKARQTPARIIYGMMFGVEFDMLDVVLHEIYPVVDAIVVIESTRSHSLRPKEAVLWRALDREHGGGPAGNRTIAQGSATDNNDDNADDETDATSQKNYLYADRFARYFTPSSPSSATSAGEAGDILGGGRALASASSPPSERIGLDGRVEGKFGDKIHIFRLKIAPKRAHSFRSGWEIERRQRNLFNGFLPQIGVKDGDIVVANMDLDEIVTATTLLKYKYCEIDMSRDTADRPTFTIVHFRYHLGCLQELVGGTIALSVYVWDDKTSRGNNLYNMRKAVVRTEFPALTAALNRRGWAGDATKNTLTAIGSSSSSNSGKGTELVALQQQQQQPLTAFLKSYAILPTMPSSSPLVSSSKSSSSSSSLKPLPLLSFGDLGSLFAIFNADGSNKSPNFNITLAAQREHLFALKEEKALFAKRRGNDTSSSSSSGASSSSSAYPHVIDMNEALNRDLNAMQSNMAWHMSTFGGVNLLKFKRDNSPHRFVDDGKGTDSILLETIDKCYFNEVFRGRVRLWEENVPLLLRVPESPCEWD